MSLEFDESILPGAVDEEQERREQRVCYPGEKLFLCSDGYQAGGGCYVLDDWIYASLAGCVRIFDPNPSMETSLMVEVHCPYNQRVSPEKRAIMDLDQLQMNAQFRNLVPFSGGIVTARVDAITLRYAKCSIICVEETILRHEFSSTLRKEDVRDKEKDKVEIYRCVQPGDIILARVLGYGDSQSAYLLSIAEEKLGVIYGKGLSGEWLVPEGDGRMLVKDLKSELREERKVAIVPGSLVGQ